MARNPLKSKGNSSKKRNRNPRNKMMEENNRKVT
jgi:hypothetical protein